MNDLKISLNLKECEILKTAINDRVIFEERKIEKSSKRKNGFAVGFESRADVENNIKKLKSIRKILNDYINEFRI